MFIIILLSMYYKDFKFSSIISVVNDKSPFEAVGIFHVLTNMCLIYIVNMLALILNLIDPFTGA